MDKLNEILELKNEIISNSVAKEGDKLSARNRINLLFDDGSFIETDIFSGRGNLSAEGVITGYGTVDERLVFAYAQDGNAEGGAFGVEQYKKISKVMDLALKAGAPVVSLLDSSGLRYDEELVSLSSLGELSAKTAKASGSILQISAIFGTCAGGASFVPNMADFLIMTKDSALMINGTSVCGEEGKVIEVSDMCGAEVNAKISGNASFVAENDEEAILKIRELISYLPGNSEELPPEIDCEDDLNRLSEALNTLGIPMVEIIKQVADNCEFSEISPLYADNLITGFIRINGRTVAVVANNGELDSASCEKASKFICFADSFNIPILTFSDTEGFKASFDEERCGLAKYASKLLAAYSNSTVPMVTVICSKAYTSSGILMGSRSIGADFAVAWPNAVIGALTPKMASVLLCKEGLSREEVKEYYANNVATALSAAQTGFIDDVIDPSTTRQIVSAAFEMLYDKREEAPVKKHGKFSF